MVKNLLFLLIIILIICSFYNSNEHYYTFFNPFLDLKNQKTYDYNKVDNKYFTFVSYKEFDDILTNILKIIIANTNIIFIKKYITNDISNSVKLLNNNNIQFVIYPFCLLESYLFNETNLRYMINVNKTIIYLITNNNKIDTINDIINNNLTIGIDEKKSITYKIAVRLFENKLKANIKYNHDNINNNIKKLLDKNKPLDTLFFIDSNPSNILNNILNIDIKNNIKIINLKLTDFNLPKSQLNFFEENIKFIKPSIIYPNFKYTSFAYLNTLLTNKYVSSKNAYELTEFIYKYFNNNNKNESTRNNNLFNNIDISFKNLKKSNILTHRGSNYFFKDKGLFSINKNCYLNIGKIKCTNDNYN